MTPELANFLMMAFTNPQGFAERMGRTGVRPEELVNTLGSGDGGMGDAFSPGITGPGAVSPGRLLTQTPPESPESPQFPETFDAGPPPTSEVTDLGAGNPFGIDTSNLTPSLDIIGPALGLMGGGATPPPTGDPGGLERILGINNPNQRRWPQVRMPDATKPEFRGGITGAQKAPDLAIKPGPSPAQMLMMLLGNQDRAGGKAANPLRVPSLGEMFMR